MMSRVPIVSAVFGTCAFVVFTIVGASDGHSGFPARTEVPSDAPHYLPQQPEHPLRWASTTASPPIVLEFLTSNGSVFSGPNIDLSISFRTRDSRTDKSGRQATHQEIHDLAQDGITMCFELSSLAKSLTCAPILQTWITIHNIFPGAWHTITATLVYDPAAAADGNGVSNASGSEENGDIAWQRRDLGATSSVTVFVVVEGYPKLPLCGGSACLDSSDARSAYFDQLYR